MKTVTVAGRTDATVRRPARSNNTGTSYRPGPRPLTSTYGPIDRGSIRLSNGSGPRNSTDTTAGSTVPRDPGGRFRTVTRTAANKRSPDGSIVTVTRAV